MTLELEMGSPKVTAIIDKSYELAQRLKITGTPTYILGDELIPGAVGPDFVAKPVLAREGANIEVVSHGKILARSHGSYDASRMVYQQRYPLKDFGRGYPVLGSWIVAGEAAGLGIREDGLITGNRARFVPHIILD